MALLCRFHSILSLTIINPPFHLNMLSFLPYATVLCRAA